MTAFTVIGVLWFWMLCFELGYALGYLADEAALLLKVRGHSKQIHALHLQLEALTAYITATRTKAAA